MFDNAQDKIVQTLVPTMRAKGYSYYVAYTNNDYSGYYTSEPDLFFIFSRDKIQAPGAYTYNIPQDSLRYIICSYDYSTGSSAVNTDRIKSENFSGTLKVEPYEHIYSNAEYSGNTIQPDIMKGERYSENTAIQANGFLMCVALLLYCTFRLFKH